MSSPSVRVLIAEDEIMIAGLIEATLQDEGLAATVAYSGSEALTAISADPTGFQVLITDIRVGAPPDGWGVAHAAREANPAIGVIYITGDSMEAWRANGVPASILIAKPFVPAQIVTAVMTLLNQPAAAPAP
jgi:DNA-binding response OmpR family regulator